MLPENLKSSDSQANFICNPSNVYLKNKEGRFDSYPNTYWEHLNLFVDDIKLVNRDRAIAKFSQVERKVMKILNLALVLGTSDNKVLV